MLSYVLPTRNRPERLRKTLEAIDALGAQSHEAIGGAEVIVVDNASQHRLDIDQALASRLRLRIIELESNIGAAARNIGAEQAQGDWIIMLDDDSHPLDCSHIEVLLNAPKDVAAIGADIFLPDGSRERGGLPEVIVGCGAAVRRDAFLSVGGYDASFDYYVEEYDLCAKLILNGWRIVHDQRFRVLHEKVTAGRDFNVIARRLVRNNCWVMQRYAPQSLREAEIHRTIECYAGIAVKERAAVGFAQGMSELDETLHQQPRREMNEHQWQRFTGEAAARNACSRIAGSKTMAIVESGKNAEIIHRVVAEICAELVEDPAKAEAIVIGTLSPGPMRDAWRKWGGRATMCA